MKTSTNPENMSLDEIFAEIIALSEKAGVTSIVALWTNVDRAKVEEVKEARSQRISTLCDEIRRRVWGEE
jgi:hypothetical protein